MTPRALIVAVCVGLVVVQVALAATDRPPTRLTPVAAQSPSVTMPGLVTGMAASPKYEGCVYALGMLGVTFNLVAQDASVQSVLTAAFIAHVKVRVIATKLPGPPAGATGWPGDWYQVQSVSASQ